MATIKDASDVLALLLMGGYSTIAGRLAGAFKNVGRPRLADEIVKTMQTAGYAVRERDPFADRPDIVLPTQGASPYINRIRLMWKAMRECVLKVFPVPPKRPNEPGPYLKAVEAIYVTDAYNSLSIEGYRVSSELIERVRSGAWNPVRNPDDRGNGNALAVRGYYDAFISVRSSVEKVLGGRNAGDVSRDDHAEWYRRLFGPSVTAGVIRPVDLAGYRGGPIHIRRSMDETINAGRRLLVRRSVKGKGTTTTSSDSKVTPRFLVFGRNPFTQNFGEALQVLVLPRRHLAHHQVIAVHFERNHVTLDQIGRLTDVLGDRRLPTCGDFGEFHRLTSLII